jgi:purine-cytosine permease-like protein
MYERAPYFWLLVGLALVIVSVYLGIEMSRTFLYYGLPLGFGSCIWGIRILMKRTHPPEAMRILNSPPPSKAGE